MDQNKRDGLKQVWKSGYSFSPIIYRENAEVMGFTFDNYIYTASVPLGFLKTDKNYYQYGVDRPLLNPSSPIENVGGRNYFIVNNRNTSQTYNGNNYVAETIDFSVWPYNNIPKLSNLTTNCSFLSNRFPSPRIYKFDIFNFTDYQTRQFTGITPLNPSGYTDGFYNDPPNASPTSSLNNIHKITRAGAYNIYGGVSVGFSIYDAAPGWSMFKVALVVEKTDQAGFINNNWGPVGQFPIVSTGTIVSGRGSRNFNQSNGSILLDDYSGYTLTLDLPTSTIYNLNVGDYLRISFYFLDIQGIYNYADQVKIFFANAHWGVADYNNRTIRYIYNAYYTSPDPFFTIGTTYQPNDTLNFFSGSNYTASSYFYSSSFIGTSPNYSSVINNLSVEKGDLIKFGKFEDPGEYYEVITSSGYPYSAVVSTSIITGSINMSSNFAILRPKPDETSVILEGRKALGTKEVAQSVLIPYDASSELKAKVGEIIKSVNTLI
jgi:hypothetical protein